MVSRQGTGSACRIKIFSKTCEPGGGHRSQSTPQPCSLHPSSLRPNQSPRKEMDPKGGSGRHDISLETRFTKENGVYRRQQNGVYRRQQNGFYRRWQKGVHRRLKKGVHRRWKKEGQVRYERINVRCAVHSKCVRVSAIFFQAVP